MVWLDFFHCCLAIAAASDLLTSRALNIHAIYAVLTDSAGNTSQSHHDPLRPVLTFPCRFVP